MTTERGRVVLVGGPAGAAKSTLASAWCARRPRAAHVELDAVRGQSAGELQAAQYVLAVEACPGLARTFAAAGYDVAIDDVLEPTAFDRAWRPRLDGLAWTLVVVLPSLGETLARAAARDKRVREEHIRNATRALVPVARRTPARHDRPYGRAKPRLLAALLP